MFNGTVTLIESPILNTLPAVKSSLPSETISKRLHASMSEVSSVASASSFS